MRIFFLAALCCVSFCGCIFIPPTLGERGIVVPGVEQYDKYLTNCCGMSPVLNDVCRTRGKPAAIKIGYSGGYFVWKEPALVVSVGVGGNTTRLMDVPRDLRSYAGLGDDLKEEQWRKENPFLATIGDAAKSVVPASMTGSQLKVSAPVTDRSSPSSTLSVYSVERFERESDASFSYVFKIVFPNTNVVSLADGQRVKRELRTSIEEDYRAACPDARGESVQIDFPIFSMRGGTIEGKAELTRIAVTSFTYDDVTHKGVIAVRIGSSSFEKARVWVRKNIETIVRDKNIALTTNKLPENKRFYLGTERVLQGNVLEIEFEAE